MCTFTLVVMCLHKSYPTQLFNKNGDNRCMQVCLLQDCFSMHRRTGRGGTCPPPVRPETLISRAISTQESGNLPYHVKTICSNLQKSIKKEQFHPQNARNDSCETLHFKIFAGENAPGLPLRHSSRPRVGQTNVCPSKISWPVRLCFYAIFKHKPQISMRTFASA